MSARPKWKACKRTISENPAMRGDFYTIMLDEIFISGLAIALMIIFTWAFRNLPDEKWQIIGCIPYKKLSDGSWRGWNLTWYGFLNATAILFAVCILLLLLGAVFIPIGAALLILVSLLLICLPASRATAWLIEKKHNTASVGGASFLGIIAAPWLVFLAGSISETVFDVRLSVILFLSAMSVAYALGEGFGRLACISFGCCYGKPVSALSPRFQKIFNRYSFTFTGKTKKIAYAHGLDGQKIFPIQALTALLYSAAGLIGCYLFLQGYPATAFILTLSVTQLWRFFSEFARIDDRGGGEISAYQKMALFSWAYGLIAAFIFHERQLQHPHLIQGFSILWHPALIIFLIVLWTITFYYTGKSSVTTSLLDIRIQNDQE